MVGEGGGRKWKKKFGEGKRENVHQVENGWSWDVVEETKNVYI